MMISSKGEYAARALLYLALAAPGGERPVSADEIARAQKIPKKYLQQILLLSRKAGLVGSKPGLNGGYFLARPAGQITMAQVLLAVDGLPVPEACANATGGAGCTYADRSACALSAIWGELGQAMVGLLEKTTLEQVASRARDLSGAQVPMYYI